MCALVTADWSPYARNKYFRKIELYSMVWHREVNLETCSLTVAQNGGPIVILRDRAKLLKMQGPSHQPIVAIYSSSGKLLNSFVWDKGQLVQLGWSSTEDLLCIQEDGKVLIYNMFGVYQHAWDIFLMGKEASGSKIVSATIFPSPGATGLAVITSANEVFVVTNVNENHRRVRQLSKCPSAPTAWTVICEERQTKVIVSKNQNLYTLQSDDSPVLQKIDLGAGSEKYSIVSMAVSPDYQKIALFINNGKLWIKSSDLRSTYRLYDTQQLSEPKQLVWCGSDAVVCYWGSTINVIGCTEDQLSYVYDYPVFLVSEIDCVRVLSAESHHIIQCVPTVVQEIFQINSESPGCFLLEASKQFQKRSHRANEYIHIVKPKISSAVTQCIQAAGHEFNASIQKSLMTAAQFGKCFMTDFDSSEFVKMCRVLRLLNQVRDPQVGIAITYEQYEQLGIDKLIDMLILRRYYYLALEVSKYLRLSSSEGSERILLHWAYYKMEIRNYPMAEALYIKYCKSHNKRALHEIYKQEDDYNNKAACQIKEAYLPGNTKEAGLLEAQENFKKSKSEFAAFAAMMCEEELKLIKHQKQLEDKLKKDFLGLTLNETLEKLLSLKEVKLADNMKSEYKVPDRR
uniref:Vacuolar protein sorting-associated protein 16 homolog n=1 Tax=Cacopsylla melanoneura TaxID=428564 RepID=A0A8D8YC56_9HEMI